MLARYTIYRRRPKDGEPLPEGVRQDTRWRTKHILRPEERIVEAFLKDPSDTGWNKFSAAYSALLAARFKENRERFEQLASLATEQDVFLGCNCPTQKNPDVRHCHTFLALDFMKYQFPTLDVVYPEPVC